MNDPACYPHIYADGSPLCPDCQPSLYAYAASGRLAAVLETFQNPFDSAAFSRAWTGDIDRWANADGSCWPNWDRRWAMISVSIGRVVDPDAMFARCGSETPYADSHRGWWRDDGRWILVTPFTGMPVVVSSGAPGGPRPKTV